MAKLFRVAFEDVVSVENLCAAWQEFLLGKRRKADVLAFARNLGDEIMGLHDDLSSDHYRHGPYERFAVNDPKPRVIHKASVRDRLLHHAVHRQLYPLFARTFTADSFSCQVGKGTHRAQERFRRLAWRVSHNHTRTCWVLKCDVRKFFASIDHGILISLLCERLVDARLTSLLEIIVRSHEAAPGRGLPLGNLTSQLFANVYLNELDQFVKRRFKAKSYVRYADDFVLMSESRERLEGLIMPIKIFLRERLRLDLHPDKISLKTLASGVDFLGWVHFPDHRVLRTVSKWRMFRNLRESSGSETLQSYLGLLGHGNARRLADEIRNLRWLYGEGDEG